MFAGGKGQGIWQAPLALDIRASEGCSTFFTMCGARRFVSRIGASKSSAISLCHLSGSPTWVCFMLQPRCQMNAVLHSIVSRILLLEHGSTLTFQNAFLVKHSCIVDQDVSCTGLLSDLVHCLFVGQVSLQEQPTT